MRVHLHILQNLHMPFICTGYLTRSFLYIQAARTQDYTECVLFTIQNVFSLLYRMCPLYYTECVLFTIQNVFSL